MTETIISIVLSVLSIVLAVITYYLDVKRRITNKAVGLINDVEHPGNGEEKMEIVVSELYKMIPIYFRPILTKANLRTLVQALFDEIENYAEKQNDNRH